MLIKIRDKQGYRDRFGEFHPFLSEWDAPEAIAAKLVNHRIALPVSRPIVEVEPEVEVVPEVLEPEPDSEEEPGPEPEPEPDLAPPLRPRGRPRKV